MGWPSEVGTLEDARTLTRREILGRGALAAAGAAAATVATAKAGERSDEGSDGASVVVGSVVEVDSSSVLVRTGDGEVWVDVPEGAEVSKDGATELASFVAGDEVSAVGEWSVDRFLASSFSSLYRPLEGDVTSRDGNRLETTAGQILLTEETREHEGPYMRGKRPEDVGPGDRVAATGRVDPETGELVAVSIGVLAHRP